jgi:hypothetical protein
MGRVSVKNLSLKAEMGRAINDFDTWPQWAKDLPFENSDRVMEGRLAEQDHPSRASEASRRKRTN